MPDTPNAEDEFKVHDVQISNQPQFDRTGQASMVTVVSYYVGAHGPFQHSYAMGQGTPEKVRADIQTNVQGLRRTLAPFDY